MVPKLACSPKRLAAFAGHVDPTKVDDEEPVAAEGAAVAEENFPAPKQVPAKAALIEAVA